MSAHSIALDRLAPYVDDALTLQQRAAVQGHVQGCAPCMLELKRLLELNAVLQGFAPAPPANFAAFWLRLRAGLPRPPARVADAGLLGGRRIALAFAMAALLALAVGTGAFAAETALPDSPLYPLKRAEEQVQLGVTFAPQARLEAEVRIANERLREARAMTGLGKGALAAASLRDFNTVLAEIQPELSRDELASFQLQLTALQQVATVHEAEARGLIAAHPGVSGEPSAGNGGTDNGTGNGGVPGDGHAYGKGHGKGPVVHEN